METKIILTPTTHGVLSLGRQMEDDVRSITFDCNALVEEFGEGSATLVHQRSGDEAPYLVTITESEENVYTWTLTNLDTAFCGIGKAEIRWTTADGLGKSVTFMTQVLPSITGDTTIPEPLQSWYDAMIQWIIDHSITVNIIKDAEIVEKKILKLPHQLVNIIHCKNPRCITSIEQELPHKFILSDRTNLVYRCVYCEQKFKGFK